jgi:hypothetical protein
MMSDLKYDLKVDRDKCEYYVIERDTGRTIATFRYQMSSRKPRFARGVAFGRAVVLQRRLNGG